MDGRGLWWCGRRGMEILDAVLALGYTFSTDDPLNSLGVILYGKKPKFKNEHGKLNNITTSTGLENYKGWWNSITAGDFDNDGDIDYIVGNLGTNSYYRGNEKNPVSIYGGDFAHNNRYVGVPSLYLDQGSPIKG